MGRKINDDDVHLICNDPVEKKLVLLYEMASAMDMLVHSIDRDLCGLGYSFDREKKMLFNRYAKSAKETMYWYERLGIDDTMWKAVGETLKGFDNCLADSAEMLRFLMLYVDRSISQNGFEAINRFMVNLPSNGIFSDAAIKEFKIDRPYKFDIGDRVGIDGKSGKIVGVGNDGYWVVDVDGDRQRIIHETQLKLL